jgi:hypothetical protein
MKKHYSKLEKEIANKKYLLMQVKDMKKKLQYDEKQNKVDDDD